MSGFMHKASANGSENVRADGTLPGYSRPPMGSDGFTIRLSDSVVHRLNNPNFNPYLVPPKNKKDESNNQKQDSQNDMPKNPSTERHSQSTQSMPAVPPIVNDYMFQPYVPSRLIAAPRTVDDNKERNSNDKEEAIKAAKHEAKQVQLKKCADIEQKLSACLSSKLQCEDLFVAYDSCIRMLP